MSAQNRQYLKLISRNQRRLFEGEGTTATQEAPPAQNQTQGQGPGTQSQGQGTQGQGTQGGTQNQGTQKTYTEQQYNELLNRRLGEERRKLEDRNRQTVQELTALRESANLTEDQRNKLQLKIEELESTYRTSEEQKKIELGKFQEKYDKDTAVLKNDRDSWKRRFEDRLVAVDIRDAAVESEAFSPEQIEAILRPMTRAIEETDSEGKPTGIFISKVKFQTEDKENKPVVLDLSVKDAVKAMRDLPHKYGNLFKNKANGGLGSMSNGAPSGANILRGVEDMSLEQYRKNRELIRRELKKG